MKRQANTLYFNLPCLASSVYWQHKSTCKCIKECIGSRIQTTTPFSRKVIFVNCLFTVLFSENVLLSSKNRTIASHVFEPCCSESGAFSGENPIRSALYMTDKEIVQQYSAAIGRMINKVNDMRFIIYSRYIEHLKKKPAVKAEQKKCTPFCRILF